VKFLLALALAGCAGPFEIVTDPQTKSDVTVSSCGASEMTAGTVLRAMDNPPVGEGAGTLPPTKNLEVCVRVTSHATGAVRVEPQRWRLKTPREGQPWNAEHADEERVLAAGESRKFSVTFSYPPLSGGERITILFDDGFRIDDKRITLPPLSLRKR
jgi:hypothetical protein